MPNMVRRTANGQRPVRLTSACCRITPEFSCKGFYKSARGARTINSSFVSCNACWAANLGVRSTTKIIPDVIDRELPLRDRFPVLVDGRVWAEQLVGRPRQIWRGAKCREVLRDQQFLVDVD